MLPPAAPAYLLCSPEEGCVSVPAPAPATGACRLLLSFDYDGTLKQHDDTLEPEFFALMRRLTTLGVRWGINTGRSLHKLEGELPLLPHMPHFICTCERYVYMAGEDGLLHPAAAHNARCHRANMELRERALPAWQATLQHLRSRFPEAEWEVAADDPLSIEAATPETLDILMPHLEPHAAAEEVAIQRAGRFMRLSDARFTKGSALRYVQQSLGVPEEQLFIMGDGHNDIDAFRHFTHAFCAAPADAHPEVTAWLREHGGYVSPAPGVLQAVSFWLEKTLAAVC